MMVIAILFVAIMLGAMGQVALKHGMTSVRAVGVRDVLRDLPGVFGNPYMLAGVFCYGASSVLWLYSMTNLDISFMYPLASLSYVVTTVLAIIFLKERVIPMRWIGLAMIVAGSFLITRT
jgi:drug/metabolite transporter (DMT)-like permease